MATALWIGGPPGSGKTTVATRLVRRHGLRLYSCDTRTWLHRDRAIASGNEAAVRWESLPPEQRANQPAEDLLAMSLHRERGAMAAEDVAALPSAPLVVAEGSVIGPRSVPPGQRGVWLLPPPSVQEQRLQGRDGRTNVLYRLVAADIEAEIALTGAPTLAIEGIAAAVEAVEQFFAAELAAGPRAESAASRRALLREANLDHVEQVRAFYRRAWADGDAEAVVRTFICECGERRCDADVRVAVSDAVAGPVLAPGHGGAS